MLYPGHLWQADECKWSSLLRVLQLGKWSNGTSKMNALKYQHPCSVLLSTEVQQTLLYKHLRDSHITHRISTRVLRELGEHIKIIFLYSVLEIQGHHKDTKGFTILPSPFSHSHLFPWFLLTGQRRTRLAHLGQFQSWGNFQGLGMTHFHVVLAWT